MSWKDDYQRKLTTAAEAVKAIKSGNRVVVGHAYGQPQHLVNAMVTNKDAYEDVEIVHMVSLSPAPYCLPEMQKHFIHNSFFVGINSREAVNQGRDGPGTRRVSSTRFHACLPPESSPWMSPYASCPPP